MERREEKKLFSSNSTPEFLTFWADSGIVSSELMTPQAEDMKRERREMMIEIEKQKGSEEEEGEGRREKKKG